MPTGSSDMSELSRSHSNRLREDPPGYWILAYGAVGARFLTLPPMMLSGLNRQELLFATQALRPANFPPRTIVTIFFF